MSRQRGIIPKARIEEQAVILILGTKGIQTVSVKLTSAPLEPKLRVLAVVPHMVPAWAVSGDTLFFNLSVLLYKDTLTGASQYNFIKSKPVSLKHFFFMLVFLCSLVPCL